jgi:NMD protein affecting ribosome stability and mRNA decay
MSRYRCPSCGRLVRGGVKQLCPKCLRDRELMVTEILERLNTPERSVDLDGRR